MLTSQITWLHFVGGMLKQCPFWHKGPVLWKTVFPWTGGEGDGFRMIQMCYNYCALYFYYYIRSTSDHQALGPGGWGPRGSGK